MDYRDIMIDALDTLRKRDLAEKQQFKARAYQTVITQLKQLPHIYSQEDLKAVTGRGEKIQKKIDEIFATGQLKTAEKAKEIYHVAALDLFQQIYGIGPTKATELVKAGYRTIADLRTNPTLLNDKQLIGLQYYEALIQRIPREEMMQHEQLLLKHLKDMMVVGSYRRGAADSGDIDVLLRVPTGTDQKAVKAQLAAYVKTLQQTGYICEVLALGEHKCMAICRLGAAATPRRLDLLMIPEDQYASALLYFTGSDKFNVAFRQHALDRGYTLNEYGLTRKNEEARPVPPMKEEKDLFVFLGLSYVPPTSRNTSTLPPLRKPPPKKNVPAQ